MTIYTSDADREYSSRNKRRSFVVATGRRRAIAVVLLSLGLIVPHVRPEEAFVAIGWMLLTTAGMLAVKRGGEQDQRFPFPPSTVLFNTLKGAVCMFLAIILLQWPSGRLAKEAEVKARAERQRVIETAAVAARADAAEKERISKAAHAKALIDGEQTIREFESKRREFDAALANIRSEIRRSRWDVAEAAFDGLGYRLAALYKSGLDKSPRVAKFTSEFEQVQVTVQAHRKQEAAEQARRENIIRFANPTFDIVVMKSSWRKGGFGVVAEWTVTLKNTNSLVTYADIEYATTYSAPSGTTVDQGSGKILQILRPGKTRTFEVNDGFLNSQAAGALFRITGAEKRN
jgi:hypothetical protein